MRFHDGITFERIKLEGWNLFQSVQNGKLRLGRNRHDCQIIILAKIANLTLSLFQKKQAGKESNANCF